MSYNNYQQGYGQPPNQQGPNNGHQHDAYGQQQQYGAPPSQPSYGDPTLHYAAPPQQYGAPPPQQYGAPPPQQYGAPLSQQYGAPPSQQYGAPPSQQYGAPPSQQYAAPQQQYGAPQQQYGASTLTSGQLQQPQAPYGQQPPYGQQQQYGQQQSIPPSNGYTYAQQGPLQPSYPAAAQQAGCFFLGVAIPPPPPALPLTQLPGYDPAFDSDRVRKATKGFGTDERALIDVLTPLDAFKMELLSRTYEGLVGRSLQQTLEKELSGWLENGLVLLSLGPLKGDLHLLHRACAGAGTHEDLLSELLINRSNQEIWMLKEGYQRMYHKDLVGVVKGELSMKTERMFIMALAGTRDENPMVDQGMVQRDVQSLHSAGVGKIGTDEIKICGILQQRSDAHMHELARAYQAAHKIKLSDMVHREFSGHMQDALIFLVKYFEGSGRGIERDADMLHDAMAGMGTKDERLVWRIVRGHWNKQRWQEVKMLYQTKYRNSLERAVKGETTGKYERLLVQLIE